LVARLSVVQRMPTAGELLGQRRRVDAWVYVVPHPWFAVSDVQGKFKIEAVPSGEYTLWLRHPDTGVQERQDLEVEAGKTAGLLP